MALNKYMHPRNIYKTPPDFEKLSKLSKEFSMIAKMDVTGKFTIDFKDPYSLRVLTKCLLKFDFNLDVEIPEDRLVPTLPLRLNYILWIEDLMIALQRNSEIHGIDIGTGACAVYPLLAAVKNKWHMLATEVDSKSLQKAQENILRNNLQGLIELKNNRGSKLIESLFAKENIQMFDFCMCNPPFYSNFQELCESRSPARLPPKNGFTGSPQELITEGGELKFCRKLIDESKRCKNSVLVFTTMIGHKYNLLELLQDLKADGINHTHTEFCQGRVTRWGLAWTYQKHDIYHLVPPRNKPRRKNVPVSYQLPQIPNYDYNVETAYKRIKTMLSSLKIEQKILNKYGNNISLDILAKENTWSNQRRKKRLLKRTETTDAKKLKSDKDNPETTDAKLELDRIGSTYEETNKINTESTGAEILKSERLTNDETIKSNPKTNDVKTLNLGGDEATNDDISEDNPETTDVKILKSERLINNETIDSYPKTNDDKKLNPGGDETINDNMSEENSETTDAKILKSERLTNIENIDSNPKTNEVKKSNSGWDEAINDDTSENNLETTDAQMMKSTNYVTRKSKPCDTNSKASNQNDPSKLCKSNQTNIIDRKLPQQAGNNEETEPLLHAFMKLFKKEDIVQLEIEFLNGTGGKESVHQVIQFIKNNWK